MLNTIILDAWDNGFGRKIAITATSTGYTPLSRGCNSHYQVKLFEIDDDLNDFNEMSSEDLTLDFNHTFEELWLEAMLSWGTIVSNENMQKCNLDSSQIDVVDFCIENSINCKSVVEFKKIEVVTWSSKLLLNM
jgi:hypothetical protein